MLNLTSSVALAIIALPFVCGLDAYASDTRATVESRVKALETKTDYYKKTNRRLLKNYRRSATGKAASCQTVEMVIDPKITLGGVSYAWVTATVAYRGSPVDIISALHRLAKVSHAAEPSRRQPGAAPSG